MSYIHAVRGEPKVLFKETLVHVPDGRATVTLGVPSGIHLAETLPDRFHLFPEVAGDHTLQIRCGQSKKPFLLRVSEPLTALSGNRSAIFVGDSGAAAGDGTGFPKMVKDRIDALYGVTLTNLGTHGTPPYLHESVGGQTYTWAATNVASPFVHNGVIDIPHYVGVIGAVPSFAHWSFGSNDIFTIPLADVPAAIAASLANFTALFDAWRSDYPEVVHVVSTIWQGNNADAVWTAEYPLGVEPIRKLWLQKVGLFHHAQYEQLGNREDDNLVLNVTHGGLSGWQHYISSAFHYDFGLGHPATAEDVTHSLVAAWDLAA